MSTIDIDALDIDELERLRDACNRRILEMRRTKGLALPELLRLLDEVKVALGDQGKEWHSLERWQWMDGEIRFWLNPKDHENYNTGWFSIDQLIAWSHDHGPVLVEQEDEEEEADESVEFTWFPQDSNRNKEDEDRLPNFTF
jgi:hypothetical protein